MKVLFLTQTGDLGPASRYRVYMLLPLLEKLGIEATVSPAIDNDRYTEIYREGGGKWKKAEAYQAARQTRKDDLRRVEEFDAVFAQKGLLPGRSRIEEDFAKKRPLIHDFDDAIWLPRVGGDPILRTLHRERLVQRVIRSATAVVVGNKYLAKYARSHNPRVTVIPSAIDIERYSNLSTPEPSNPPRIGWIGSRSTLSYLRPLSVVFKRLQHRPRVIASGDPASLDYPVDFVQWNRATEIEELNRLDIGIAPLPDTPWEQGKCGTKVLQYMACGKPVVASPVGVNAMLVRDGVNGFHAGTVAEWRDRLQQLIDNPDLRREMGAKGRQMVEKEFTAQRSAQRLADVFQSAVENWTPQPPAETSEAADGDSEKEDDDE